ncbi:MAG: M50 family metallopeptidase [Bradymonadales bacterium]|jgi:Zn-dependent protease
MKAIFLFSFKDIPVGVNPMYLLLMLFLGYSTGSWTNGLIFALCATVALLFHEFGHALFAKRYGLEPKVLLHGFGGLTLHEFPKSNGQDFRITLAGPLTSLLLGAVFLGITMGINLGLSPEWLEQRQNLLHLLNYSLWVNFGWGIFNLIPILPMDGGKLLHSGLKFKFSERRSQIVATIVSLVFGIAALVVAAIFKMLFMIIIIAFMVMMNINTLRAIFGKDSPNTTSREAEILYEQARVLARAHEWEQLELTAQQMKRAALGEDQVKRAYELLVIANTNMKRYEEALDYARFALQSDAVKQAVQRCETMLRNVDNS